MEFVFSNQQMVFEYICKALTNYPQIASTFPALLDRDAVKNLG